MDEGCGVKQEHTDTWLSDTKGCQEEKQVKKEQTMAVVLKMWVGPPSWA